MTTKSIDKSPKSVRPPVTRRVVATPVSSSHDRTATPSRAHKQDLSTKHPAQGRDTKYARLLQLLSRPDGTSIEEMMQATQWQQHSVRGFLAGTVKKKMGFALTSSKVGGDVRRYRIATRRGR